MAKTLLGDWGTYYNNSGTSNPSSNGDFQGRFKVSYEQDLSNAITKIYVQPYVKIAVTINSPVNLPNLSMRSTINGTAKTQTISGSFYTTDTAGINYKYKYGTEQEFTIQHDSNGQAQCSLSGLMSGSGVSKSCSHTWTLPSINVSSSIINNTSESSRINFGQPVVFSISRPNATTTHTLSYSINGTNYTIGTNVTDSISSTFPIELINSFPNNSEVVIPVTCLSNNGTSSTTTVYLKVPDTYIPTIEFSIEDVGNVPKAWGIYVKSKSKIKGIVTANGSGGSTIKRYLTNINNQNFSTSEFTSSELNIAGNVLINSSVTDTRDRVASTSQTIVVHDYATPTFVKLEVLRCDENGEVDNDGTYGKVVCQYSISACNNKNEKILKVSYDSIEKTFNLNDYAGIINATTEELFSDLDVAFNHTFNFKLIDSFNPNGIEQSYVMPPSFVLVSKRAGGKGITFGRIATEDGFHNYLPSYFHEAIYSDLQVNGAITVENIKCKNVFDEEYAKNANNYSKFGTDITSGYHSIALNLEANTTYTFSRADDEGYGTGVYCVLKLDVQTNGSLDQAVSKWIIHSDSNDYCNQKFSFTTNSTGIVLFTIAWADTLTQDFVDKVWDVLKHVQIEKGIVATSYSKCKFVGFETKSNENGTYTKFEDGTLMQRGVGQCPANVGYADITFPVPFKDLNYTMICNHKYTGGDGFGGSAQLRNITNPQPYATDRAYIYSYLYDASIASYPRKVCYIAIGKWK